MKNSTQTNCPFCGEETRKENFSFEIKSDEQVSLQLNLIEVFTHIQKQEEEKEDMLMIIKELAFKNQDKE